MKVKDWKKGIEISEFFIVVIDPGYFDDSLCIEQALYAKSLKKSTIIIKIKGTEFTIPDLFNNVVLEIEIEDAKDLERRKEEIGKRLIELKTKQ